MENIHILSTDKPSRLIKNNRGYALITDEFTQSDLDYIQAKFQHIYITNDEEIKRYGEYYLDIDTNEVKTSFENMGKYLSNEKKIILTTDPDLVKDGVQAIDDEFLEWFVKNPSCEYVEIEDSVWDGISKWIPYYDIIIPEEPNPCKDIVINDKAAIDVPFHNKPIRFENLTSEQAGYLLQVSEFYQLSGTRRSAVVPQEEPKQIKCYCGHTITCDCEPLQETLEEAAERFYSEQSKAYEDAIEPIFDNSRYLVAGFIDGAKWQAERMKQSLMKAYHEGHKSGLGSEKALTFEQWFAQFKKK